MPKRSKRDVSFEKRLEGFLNRVRGHVIESSAMVEDVWRGYEVRRTGVGSDYKRRFVDLFSGRVGPWEEVEVKAGRSQLTRRQREEARKARKKGVRYVVKRSVDDWGLLGFEEKVVSGRDRKTR